MSYSRTIIHRKVLTLPGENNALVSLFDIAIAEGEVSSGTWVATFHARDTTTFSPRIETQVVTAQGHWDAINARTGVVAGLGVIDLVHLNHDSVGAIAFVNMTVVAGANKITLRFHGNSTALASLDEMVIDVEINQRSPQDVTPL